MTNTVLIDTFDPNAIQNIACVWDPRLTNKESKTALYHFTYKTVDGDYIRFALYFKNFFSDSANYIGFLDGVSYKDIAPTDNYTALDLTQDVIRSYVNYELIPVSEFKFIKVRVLLSEDQYIHKDTFALAPLGFITDVLTWAKSVMVKHDMLNTLPLVLEQLPPLSTVSVDPSYAAPIAEDTNGEWDLI